MREFHFPSDSSYLLTNSVSWHMALAHSTARYAHPFFAIWSQFFASVIYCSKLTIFLPRVPIMGTVTKGFDARLANYLQFLVFDFWELWYSSARVPESQKLKTVG